MSRIDISRRRGVAALALVALVACVTAWLVPPSLQAQATRRAPTADGEALFRAIFFLEGPASDQVPELRRMKTAREFRQVTPRQREAIAAFQDGVLTEIRASDPEFLRSFGACVGGGDRRAIARCLTDASALVDRVIDRSAVLTKSRQDIRAAWGRESGARDAGHGVERAVVVLYPPLTYQWPNVVIKAATNGSNDLLRDDLVNSLAMRLKVRDE